MNIETLPVRSLERDARQVREFRKIIDGIILNGDNKKSLCKPITRDFPHLGITVKMEKTKVDITRSLIERIGDASITYSSTSLDSGVEVSDYQTVIEVVVSDNAPEDLKMEFVKKTNPRVFRYNDIRIVANSSLITDVFNKTIMLASMFGDTK